jgi:hypothetical protein
MTRRRKRNYQFIVVLDAADRAALEAVAEHEKLTRADVVRQLVRRRAEQIFTAQRATGTE